MQTSPMYTHNKTERYSSEPMPEDTAKTLIRNGNAESA